MWLTEPLRRGLTPHCAVCQGQADQGPVCAGCLRDLARNRHPCAGCAEPLPETSPEAALCARCLQQGPPFARVYAPLLYAPPLDSTIHALKFRQDLGAARRLAYLLDQCLMDRIEPELVVPVPLHAARIRQRGFNQALEIARPLCQARGWPPPAHVALRTRATRPQLGLSATERRRNLQNAFAIRGEVTGRSVLIMDDVLTTGSTAAALTRALLKAGASTVSVLVAARVPS